MCVTKESVSLHGASNCSWSSCREGCTNEIFECLHIYVNYRHDPEGLKNGMNFSQAEDIDLEVWDVYDARLYPNVKGCGYPPNVNCTTFAANYSTVGRTYPCYYSKKIPTMVLNALDIPGVKRDLVYAIVIPWGCFFVSILYIMVTYAGMRGPDEEDDKAQEVSSSKASKEASNYSLRSIGKTINHGMNKLRGEPDDKGDPIETSFQEAELRDHRHLQQRGGE